MKQIFTITLFLLTLSLFGNIDKKEKGNPDQSYSRSSLSFHVLDFEDYKHKAFLKGLVNDFQPTLKYDFNELEPKFIRASTELKTKEAEVDIMRKMLSSAKKVFKKQAPSSIEKNLCQKLREEGFVEKLLKYWWDVNPSGEWSNKIIGERGLYNAQYQAKMEAEKQQLNSEDILKDQGFELIGNSHILIFDFSNLLSMKERYDKIDMDNKKTSEKSGGKVKFEPVERDLNGLKGI